MSLGDFFRSQLSQVVELKNQQPDVLIHKFPSENDEIKYASKLIVAMGQGKCPIKRLNILIYTCKLKFYIIPK